MAYSKTTWKNRVVQNPQTYLQQQNADGTVTLIPKEGTVTEAGTPVNAVNMNNIENGISTLDAQNSIYNAGGTANAITVATTNGDYSYAQFKRLSIKAASDNTGNVTINVDGKGAVPALKYDKNQIPAGGIKAGKLYDFYYDTANACFFLIAKASGNAVAADVLAGKTFSSDNGADLIGNLDINKYMYIGDGFIAGDNAIFSYVQKVGNSTTSYVKEKELKVKYAGTYRISFDLTNNETVGYTKNNYGQIYINGVAVGTERKFIGNIGGSQLYTEDFTLNKGDLIQLWLKSGDGYVTSVNNTLSVSVSTNPMLDIIL